MLGVDAFWNIAERDIRKGSTGPPYAIKNLLGWTITGPLNRKSNRSVSSSHSTNFIDLNDQEDANLTELREKLWKVEGSGIRKIKKLLTLIKANDK